MDSLTQITLGAAVGELVLGRKLGNKAIFWGAVGGTIPDLDVIGNFFMTEVEALAFHRGISHSFFFSLVGSLILAWFLNWWYKQKFRRHRAFKWIKWVLTLLFYGGLVLGVYQLTNLFQASQNWIILVLGVILGILLFKRYFLREIKPPDPGYSVTFKEAYLLFFLAIFTHIILDVFTSFGTQVFAPFSNYRVALASISVADPAYTFPFLVCLIIAAFGSKVKFRRAWVWTGIGISSFYLLFTLWNKQRIDRIFDETLIQKEYKAERTYLSPYILNNFLWHCVAQQGDNFFIGAYSVFDRKKEVQQVTLVNKNGDLLDSINDHPDIKILEWFSNGYFSMMQDSGFLYLGDLRYGNAPSNYDKPEDYIFIFKIDTNKNPLDIQSIRHRDDDISEMFRVLFSRIQGI